jgi:hypothetical protein
MNGVGTVIRLCRFHNSSTTLHLEFCCANFLTRREFFIARGAYFYLPAPWRKGQTIGQIWRSGQAFRVLRDKGPYGPPHPHRSRFLPPFHQIQAVVGMLALASSGLLLRTGCLYFLALLFFALQLPRS